MPGAFLAFSENRFTHDFRTKATESYETRHPSVTAKALGSDYVDVESDDDYSCHVFSSDGGRLGASR